MDNFDPYNVLLSIATNIQTHRTFIETDRLLWSHRAPEILFRPELIGRDHYGMHESVFRSVLQSDIDLRRSFVGNVLLSGELDL